MTDLSDYSLDRAIVRAVSGEVDKALYWIEIERVKRRIFARIDE
jgi:hypothetical protein